MFCFSTNEKDKSYLRLSEDKSKKRYCSHTKSFWNQYYQSKTTLFNNVWVKKTYFGPYTNPKMVNCSNCAILSKRQKTSPLCLFKNYTIITYSYSENLLNERTEIISSAPINKVPPSTKVFIEKLWHAIKRRNWESSIIVAKLVLVK